MTKKLVEIAADIVQAQVSTNPLSSEEIVTSLRNVFSALQGMQKSEAEGTTLDQGRASEEAAAEERAPEKMDRKDSIQDDKIICLECGAEMRQLTAKHLSSHELSPRDYKKKYGFPLKQPLSAKSLSKARSKAAKKRGLPENLVKFQEQRKQSRVESAVPETEPVAPVQIAPVQEEKKEAAAATKRPRKKKTA